MAEEGKLLSQFTGRKASPKDLEPIADGELISRLVRESARALLV
jgi:hypothetical protein